MSNKTPPLVIPVVVDASGVQQGLNNVNNRLRTGVAGGSAGGVGGGGFGSGGGASIAAAAVGAAVGAYGSSGSLSGNRYGSNFSPRTQATLNNLADRIDLRRSNIISRGMQGIQNYYTRAAEIANRGNYPFARGEIKGLGGKTPMAYSLNEQGKVWGARSEAFGRFYQRNRGRLGTSISMGEVGSALKEARGPLLGILGAAYTGKKIYDLANNIGAAGSDLSGLVGSTSYGKMRNVALRQFDRGANPNPIQSMLLGGMKMTGGRETALERDAASIRKGVSGFFGVAGAAYETFRNDPAYALLLAFQATPFGGLLSGMFGGSFQESVKTEIAYRNWKAAGN